jgi:hypothetical protein
MTVSRRTAITVWTQAGGLCSFPGCHAELLKDRQHLVGQLAHIVANRANGPRGDETLSEELSDDPANIVLLCYAHHRQVDDDPDTWTAERLRTIKEGHERSVRDHLVVGAPWKSNFSQLEYINLPRLIMLTELTQQQSPIRDLGPIQSLDSVSGDSLLSIMMIVRKALTTLSVKAVPLTQSTRLSADLVGTTVSFYQNWRTKNYASRDQERSGQFVGDTDRGPQIYCKLGEWKILMLFDPKWVTTVTARVGFSSGSHRFAGLATVREVDASKKLVLATPLVLGIPN